jgi:hypothetical protein
VKGTATLLPDTVPDDSPTVQLTPVAVQVAVRPLATLTPNVAVPVPPDATVMILDGTVTVGTGFGSLLSLHALIAISEPITVKVNR